MVLEVMPFTVQVNCPARPCVWVWENSSIPDELRMTET